MQIKHTLADGRVLDSIDGYKIKRNWRTEQLYRVIEKILRDKVNAEFKDCTKSV